MRLLWGSTVESRFQNKNQTKQIKIQKINSNQNKKPHNTDILIGCMLDETPKI